MSSRTLLLSLPSSRPTTMTAWDAWSDGIEPEAFELVSVYRGRVVNLAGNGECWRRGVTACAAG